MEVTTDMLKTIAPGGRLTGFKLFPALAKEMTAQFPGGGIDTKEELRHFLTQAAHETDSFNTLVEYASGNAYNGRKDLGNTQPGMGIKYKGRGIFQTTGFINYKRLTLLRSTPSFITNPKALEEPYYAVWSAIVFWNDRHLSDIAAMPDNTLIFSKRLGRKISPVEYITLIINGGQRGIDERKAFYERAKRVI